MRGSVRGHTSFFQIEGGFLHCEGHGKEHKKKLQVFWSPQVSLKEDLEYGGYRIVSFLLAQLAGASVITVIFFAFVFPQLAIASA